MEEILGMQQWLDSFCNWLFLISEPFCAKSNLMSPLPFEKKDLSTDEISRSSKLMAMRRQTFQMTPSPRAKIILLAHVEGPADQNGYEALRRVVQEYMIKTPARLMHFRTSLLGRTFKVRPSNVPASDLALLPSDLVMVLIKSLPVGVRE